MVVYLLQKCLGLFGISKKTDAKPRVRFVFKPMQRYEMYVRGRPRNIYKGRIEDVKEEVIILSAPVEHSVPTFFPKGTQVLLAIVGLPSGRYEFQTEVVGVVEGEVPLLILKKPTMIYRKQRRQKPRVRVFCKAHYEIISRTLKKKANVDKRGKADVWDLSATGIALLLANEIPRQTRMKLSFVIPETGIRVSAVAEVVNTRWDGFSRKFVTGMVFVSILDEDRAYIDNYVAMMSPKQIDGLAA